MIRCLHINLEPRLRGGEKQLIHLYQESQKHGVTSYIACLAGSGLNEWCNEKGIETLLLKYPHWHPINVLRIIRHCKRAGIHIVHVHTSHAHTLGVLAAMTGLKAPLVLARRVFFNPGDGILSHLKYNHPAIAKIICVSHAIARKMTTYVRDTNKICVIHSGVDLKVTTRPPTPMIQRFSIDPKRPVIGFIAPLTTEKGGLRFIEAARVISSNHINSQFLIIGDGPLRQQMEHLVSTSGLDEQVIFTGWLKDVDDIFPALEMLLVLSDSEGLNTTILDAFRHEVPVIAGGEGGISELIVHEESGLLVNIHSDTEIAESCLRILKEPSLKQQLISEAKKRLPHFSKEEMAIKTVNVYKEVLSGRSSR